MADIVSWYGLDKRKTEEKKMEEAKNWVTVSLKKSSSKDGNAGFDIDVHNTDATQAQLDEIGEIALKTAMKIRLQLQ